MDREAWRATVHGVTKSGHDWATNTLAFQLLCPSLILFQPHWVLWSSSKKGNAKESSNYCTIALISHASKVILKILQARLQQYVHCELPDVQAGFRKGRGTRDQIVNICWIIEKQEGSRKTSISALLIMPKPLTVWIAINCGKFWKRWGYQTTWLASLETCMQVRKPQLELDMEQQTVSK